MPDEIDLELTRLNAESLERAKASGVVIGKNWMIAKDDRDCAVCKKNARAGYIPLDAPFPSGHQHPQAHDECRCCLGWQVDEGEDDAPTDGLSFSPEGGVLLQGRPILEAAEDLPKPPGLAERIATGIIKKLLTRRKR